MAGDNEQLKADLQTGANKFDAAATNLQDIFDAVDKRIKTLSPQEQKWIGEASSEFQKTLDSFSKYCTIAIKAMQATSSALTQMKEAIEEAERQAQEEERREQIAGIVILVLGVVLLPVAGGAAGGKLAEGSGESAAVRYLKEADKKIRGIFETITQTAQKVLKAFKTDLPEAEKINVLKVESIEPKLLDDFVPVPKVVPASKVAPAPESGPFAPAGPDKIAFNSPPIKSATVFDDGTVMTKTTTIA